MLKQLYQNLTWSQRSNYFETLTDCPQRDERLGWVGDAQFFLPSAAYNQNDASFFTKWFLDCLDVQIANGNTRNSAPTYSANGPRFKLYTPDSVGGSHLDWTAAMMVAPWTI